MLENQKLFDEQYQKLSNKVGILKVELKHLESKIERGFHAFLKTHDPIPTPIGWINKTSWFYATQCEKDEAILSFYNAEKKVKELKELIEEKEKEGKEMFHQISPGLRFAMVMMDDRFVN